MKPNHKYEVFTRSCWTLTYAPQDREYRVNGEWPFVQIVYVVY